MNIDFFLLHDYKSYHPAVTISLRLSISLLFGILVGWERRARGQPAGIRTFTMVSLSSTLLMLFSAYEIDFNPNNLDLIRIDPTRMAQGIMTGIGFLGAGLLIKESFTIRGLTTASMIWLTSAIGILIGSGLLGVALFGIALVFFVLFLSVWTEDVILVQNYANYNILSVWNPDKSVREDYLAIFENFGISVNRVNEIIDVQKSEIRLSVYVSTKKTDKFCLILDKLAKHENVLRIGFDYKN